MRKIALICPCHSLLIGLASSTSQYKNNVVYFHFYMNDPSGEDANFLPGKKQL